MASVAAVDRRPLLVAIALALSLQKYQRITAPAAGPCVQISQALPFMLIPNLLAVPDC